MGFYRQHREDWWPADVIELVETDPPREARTTQTQIPARTAGVTLERVDWRMSNVAGSYTQDEQVNTAVVVKGGCTDVTLRDFSIAHVPASAPGYPRTDGGVSHAYGFLCSASDTQPWIERLTLERFRVGPIRGDGLVLKHARDVTIQDGELTQIYRLETADHPDMLQSIYGLERLRLRRLHCHHIGGQGVFLQHYKGTVSDVVMEDVLMHDFVDLDGNGWVCVKASPKGFLIDHCTLLGSVYIGEPAENVVIRNSVISKLNVVCPPANVTLENCLIGASSGMAIPAGMKGTPAFSVQDRQVPGDFVLDGIGVRAEAFSGGAAPPKG